jgi:hypothetical protein
MHDARWPSQNGRGEAIMLYSVAVPPAENEAPALPAFTRRA